MGFISLPESHGLTTFEKQKLIGTRKDSEAHEDPIDYTINTYTGGIGIEENQNAAKSMHRGLHTVLHSTEGDPEGAMMTRVIGFSEYDNLHQSCPANTLSGQ